MRSFEASLMRVAESDATVLLLGESGAGKGYWAKALAARSMRARGPFIHVDCGQLSSSTIESDLFGHERGAFTGAHARRAGHFERAHEGTLFLDEIGELSVELQPKLLRALEERRFERLGGSETLSVDVRIIAATSRRLSEEVAQGRFREDLYFRLRVLELAVPPLRARRRDLPRIVDDLLPELCRRNRRPAMQLDAGALERLATYDWPGNVRELKNVLERAVVLASGPAIHADELGLGDLLTDHILDERPKQNDAPRLGHATRMAQLERAQLVAALAGAQGNQSAAARALGLRRMTFVNKLRKHELT